MSSDLSHPVFDLSSRLVDELVDLYPDAATYLGVPGHDDRWPDLSPEGCAAIVDRLNDMKRWVGDLPGGGTHFDRLAVSVAGSAVEEELTLFDHDDHLRDLNSIASPIQGFREVFDHMPKDTKEGWENIIARLDRLPDAMSDYRSSLALGLERGMGVAERQVRAAAKQSSAHAGEGSAFADLAAEYGSAGVGDELKESLDTAIGRARTAYGEMAEWLSDVYLPHSTPRNAVGRERYVRAAHRFLGTDIDPEETYAWGWSEVADLRARMEAAAAEIKPGASLVEVLDILKTDPDRLAKDRNEFTRLMQERTDEALERLSGTHFDVPEPIRTCVVNLAPLGGPLGAYYVSPSEDFARPGTVWWSLEGDGPFPLYDEVTTAYHEGFPGHHLQNGIQVSLADRLSRLHRLWVWKPGIGEGWALYAERLMYELGFLDSPDYVFGMLSAQMLRACRVVIDIGTHLEFPIPEDQAFNPGEPWSFRLAVDMLREYATLDAAYARSEATRYFGWPGQAIAYKVGERAILETRDRVKELRGDTFDLKVFHADLLEIGPVAIDLMQSLLTTPR
jgi:uncharacterized protein (DUF885 family)